MKWRDAVSGQTGMPARPRRAPSTLCRTGHLIGRQPRELTDLSQLARNRFAPPLSLPQIPDHRPLQNFERDRRSSSCEPQGASRGFQKPTEPISESTTLHTSRLYFQNER